MKTLYSFVFLLLISAASIAQCLTNLSLTESTCDDFGEVYLTIDFDFDPNEIGTMGFRIEGPLLSQNYNYSDLPINYGPFPGSCALGEIVIFDLEEFGCTLNPQLDPCCDNIPNCAITNLDYEIICDAGTFLIEVLDIEREFASSLGGYLRLFVNGMNYGPAQFVPYSQLPYILEFEEHPGCGNSLQLTFVDSHRPCEYEAPIFYNCCPNSALCELGVIPDYDVCDADNNLDVYLNLNATYTGYLFDVWENGEYLGQYDVGPGNSPIPFVILIEAEQPNSQFIEYEVCSVEAGCCTTTSFQHPCAPPCELSLLDLHILSCNNGLMDFELFGGFNGIGNSGFNLSVDGLFIGNFDYSTFSLANIPHANNPEVELLICDDYDPTCCGFFSFTNFCYSPPPVYCSISNLNAMPFGCENDTFNLVISFDTTAVGQSGVLMMNNGFTLPVSYDSTSLTVENYSTMDSLITIILCDVDSTNCCDTTTLFNYCVYPPACSIDSITTTFVECSGDSAIIEINYDVRNPGANGFSICMNGVVLDTFSYDLNLPYIGVSVPLICPDSVTALFEMKDLDDAQCSNFSTITLPCCGAPPSCAITNFDMNLNCQNDTVVASLVFDTMLVSTQAVVYANNVLIDTIGYDESSVSFVNTVDSTIQMVICDVLDPTCCDTVTQSNVCYVVIPDTCNFTSIDLVQNGCNQGNAVIEVGYTVEHPGTDGFGLYLDGLLIGQYDYPDQPSIVLPPLCTDSIVYTIALIDALDNNCIIEGVIDSVCCDTIVPPNCVLFGLTAEPVGDCYAGLVDIFIEFDTMDVSMGFNRFVNGVNYGYVDYIDPNAAIVGVLDTSAILEVVICDNIDTLCCDTAYMDNPCYMPPSPDCAFSNLMITQIDTCDGELITIHFDFNITNPGANGYMIEGGFPALDTFAYNEPRMITLIGDCNWDYTLYFSDIDDPTCLDSLHVGVLCCEINRCFVSNPSGLATTNSMNTSVSLKADVGDDCPDEIEVILNGSSEGTHMHEDGSISLVSSPPILTDSIAVTLCVDLEDEICIEFKIENGILSNTEDYDAGITLKMTLEGTLMIEQNTHQSIEIMVFAIDGNAVEQHFITDKQSTITLGHLSSGMYIIRAQNNDLIKVKKVLVVD